MNRIAIFPGSFDPFTVGHADVVRQALALFDSVVVAIGRNEQKRGFLSTENRKRLVESIYADEPRVRVEIYDGLTVDFARECGAVAMIRGVRSVADFEYERTIASVNARLDSSVASVVLFASSDVADISSSVIRELHSFGRSVSEFMPKGVDINDYV